MNDNPYQNRPEPSDREVWYSSTIHNIEQNTSQNTKMNRYQRKLRLTNRQGIKFIEFTRKEQIYIPESEDDEYYYIDPSHRFRPDLISQEVYGTPVLYWVILSCNDMRHPLDLDTGLTVRIPPLQSIIHDGRIM